eukprot:1242275-Rhodomonas_salina.1
MFCLFSGSRLHRKRRSFSAGHPPSSLPTTFRALLAILTRALSPSPLLSLFSNPSTSSDTPLLSSVFILILRLPQPDEKMRSTDFFVFGGTYPPTPYRPMIFLRNVRYSRTLWYYQEETAGTR